MASMQDALLDLTFFRASSGPEVLNWMVRCRFGQHQTAAGFVHRQVKDAVVIEYAEPAQQLDGDPPPEAGPSPLTSTHAKQRLTIMQSEARSLPRL
jgi:diacylglycerol kinase family enzyme